ncbi:hypothetical protein V2J09_012550 [Rumex salicifolius]
MVACWVLGSMNVEITSTFIYNESARDLWSEVLERFSQGNAPMILGSEPLPTMNKAYHLVLQVEKQKQISVSMPETSAFMAGSQHQRNVGQKGNQTDKRESSKGYPDWYKGKKGKRGESSSSI